MNNRQNNESAEKSKIMQNEANMLLVLTLFLSFGIACNSNTQATDRTASETQKYVETKNEAEENPRLLDTYIVRGFKVSYYLVPKNLTHEGLIAVAQEIHNQETDAQLILVDDESGISEYVSYAKEISKENMEVRFPKQWAENHIVGNVQKYLSGKWMLCEGNSYREISELK